jgi:hypothetical protein
LAQTDAARERPKEGDLLVNVTAAAAAPEPLKPEDLPLDGKQTLAWPLDPESKTVRSGSRLNKVLLLRLDPEGFDPETKERARTVSSAIRLYARIPAATSPTGTPTGGCSNVRATTPSTIRGRRPRWSADRRRAACLPCH